jgi:hypothetical protein
MQLSAQRQSARVASRSERVVMPALMPVIAPACPLLRGRAVATSSAPVASKRSATRRAVVAKAATVDAPRKFQQPGQGLKQVGTRWGVARRDESNFTRN